MPGSPETKQKETCSDSIGDHARVKRCSCDHAAKFAKLFFIPRNFFPRRRCLRGRAGGMEFERARVRGGFEKMVARDLEVSGGNGIILPFHAERALEPLDGCGVIA